MVKFEKPGRGRPKQPLSLTEKQLQIVTLTAIGHGQKQIAKITNTNPNTLNRHISHLLERWNVRTRTALIAKAASLGFLDLSKIEILSR